VELFGTVEMDFKIKPIPFLGIIDAKSIWFD
jgi:hypothetical protein